LLDVTQPSGSLSSRDPPFMSSHSSTRQPVPSASARAATTTRRDAISGVARIGRRTKDLTKRLGAGEIAIIDHQDLDRVAGDGLVGAAVVAVVNGSRSISGRYPNGGPQRVVEAGIVLLDDVGPEVLDQIDDGAVVTITGDRLLVAGQEVAVGTLLTATLVDQQMEAARDAIGNELEQFAVNTLEYVEKEARLMYEPLQIPDLRTDFAGRLALVVVRGVDYKEDLRHLRAYIKEYHPVLVAVDGGADALLDLRFTPDMIIGDFDSLSERAWKCGAELVHHVHPDGRGPGRDELAASGLDYHEFVIEGTSEDAAMMLAYECRARLIVAVGTHASMVEFLDKGRAGMSSTFLTRLRLGPMLVDAKGVSQLYEGRVRRRDLVMLVFAALVVMLAVVVASDSLQVLLRSMWLSLRDLWYSFTGRFS
jgi:uncharacterized membrane-anchored protein